MGRQNNNNGYGREIKCPICGKNFVIQPYHVYKDKRNSCGHYVCSYKCESESIRIHDSKCKGEQKRKEQIRKELTEL